jgi:crotonobetainyl-CoA:carnitine CoA-transferase CaiB-like acyl-CoA transferase
VLDGASWLELESAARKLAEVSGQIGRSVELDVRELLDQRGRKPQGTVSAGGSTRLLPAADGWVALTLSRPDDWELLPALFRTAADMWDWDAVAEAVAVSVRSELESAAIDLGLAIAVLPDEPPAVEQPWRLTTGQHAPTELRKVVDLSALWAGPLCASLLRRAGADVITVESASRPDGARTGDPDLHRLLHDGNTFVSLDFNDPDGLDELHRLVGEADIVVSAARIRALRNLGIDPFTTVEQQPGLTWVGISAYGLSGPWSNRIGYGDDTAVAGGLVRRGPTPSFLGDAIADPITGLFAATAAFEVLASGGGVIDIALRDAAAHVARAAQ